MSCTRFRKHKALVKPGIGDNSFNAIVRRLQDHFRPKNKPIQTDEIEDTVNKSLVKTWQKEDLDEIMVGNNYIKVPVLTSHPTTLPKGTLYVIDDSAGDPDARGVWIVGDSCNTRGDGVTTCTVSNNKYMYIEKSCLEMYNAGGKSPAISVIGGTLRAYAFSDGFDGYLYFEVTLPRNVNLAEGVDVFIKSHGAGKAGNAALRFLYAKHAHGQALGTTMTIRPVVMYSMGSQLITTSAIHISLDSHDDYGTVLHCAVGRAGTDALDTLKGDIYIDAVTFRFQKAK